MAKSSLSVNLEHEGLRETLAKFRKLPKDASIALRERSKELSEVLATKARAAAVSDFSPQSKLLATTVKPMKDRVPVVQAGGSRRVGRNRTPAYKVLFGSEFGSNVYGQFKKSHQGKEGSWFFPVVEKNQREVMGAWQKVADDIVDEFTEGGPY